MATTTTNFGFDVPTSSDLVKNGATAISTLGQDLDTFLNRPFSDNVILNSSLNIWQRGTSGFVGGSGTTYCADRWNAYRNGVAGSTYSRQVTGDTTNLPSIQYCLRVSRDSGNTSTAAIWAYQSIETVNAIPFAGKTVTVSFYARKGANYSQASSNLTVALYTGTGTDQSFSGGYTGSATPINNSATLTTTWQRFSYSNTVAATATEMTLAFNFTPVGTAGAADYFEITGVMLEVGNQMSPYAPATPTYATELAACQRYYYLTNSADSAYTMYGTAQAISTTAAKFTLPFPVTMRIAPTSVTATGNIGLLNAGNTAINNGTLTVNSASNNRASLDITGSSGVVAGNASLVLSNNSTSTSLAFSAEL